MTLEELNNLEVTKAFKQLESCCVAHNWISAMIQARPFADAQSLYQTAADIWSKADKADILNAFEGHPRIGDVNSLKAKYAHTGERAGHEQAGMNQANDAVIERMAAQNDAYFEKFGYIFIVCASGKSAAEMLAILESRLLNDPETELAIAATEQSKITQLRLEKLLSDSND